MNIRNIIITAVAVLAVPFAASAATFVIPAAGNATGAYGSVWQSDVTLHSTSSGLVRATLRFRDGGTSSPQTVILFPKTTLTLENIVKTAFNRTEATGAIEIEVSDVDARRIAITSRTYNVTAAGEFGQNIPAIRIDEAAEAHEIVAINGPATASKARFNFGLYAVTDTTVKWELLRRDGTIAAAKEETYKAGTQRQYSTGAVTFFGSTSENNDSVHATLATGNAIFFGSTIDLQTGDPTYVPAVLTRDAILINFLGVDIDEDGKVDIADADHDGILDATLEISTVGYPNFFRVMATGEFGETVTFEMVSAPLESAIITSDGTVQAAGPGDLKGKTYAILIRATAGGTSSILRIPVHYR